MLMKNYWQYGAELPHGIYPPGTETQFSKLDLDSEELFNKNKPTGWTADSFSYKYNSHGFRSREFDVNHSKPVILGFGCSFTNGVGIPFEDTWLEQLGNKFTEYTPYNAGLGGASADTIARLACGMIPIIKPTIVAILWPSMYRFETYEKNAVFNGPWLNEPMNLQFEDSTAYNNQMKNKLIIELLQKIHGFELLSIDTDLIFDVYGHNWPKARDGAHFAREWHTQVANDFYLEYLHREKK